jgi:DNA-binding transcriptional ArsR family regulator
MLDVDVIADPAAAAVALDPVRSRLLAELAEPASAAALASRMKLPRQKLNYHLRALEARNLVTVAEERQWGGLTERLLVSSARSFVVSPEALGPAAADPARSADRFAAGYLIALGARIVREVGDLWRRAREAHKHLATLAIDTEIRFASPADRAAFTHDLTRAVTELVGRYHNASAQNGRAHRLVIVSHPLPQGPR